MLTALSLPASAPLPEFRAVYPSGRRVPENLLRFSLVFRRVPAGPVLPGLRLLRADGTRIDQPFLEQELWSPERHLLTVLMHPGRVKTGLIANETLGRALKPGTVVRLAWNGQTLKTWAVGPADTAPLDPSAWRVSPPAAGSKRPLMVRFDHPIDALDVNLLAVAEPSGERLPGQGALGPGELSWTFRPARPWRSARYRLRLNPELEDACGNRVGEAFEHPAGRLQRASAYSVPDSGREFTVKSR